MKHVLLTQRRKDAKTQRRKDAKKTLGNAAALCVFEIFRPKGIVQSQLNSEEVSVFFYGLFMDESLLASKGVVVSKSAIGYVDGYSLRIGKRATLVRDPDQRAYGVLMTLRATDVKTLYSDGSVADYVPETISVVLLDVSVESAVCYNLPKSKLEGANPEYANSLLRLAAKLGLPDHYLQQIREQAA